MGAEVWVGAAAGVGALWCLAGALASRGRRDARWNVPLRKVRVAPDADGSPGLEVMAPGLGVASGLAGLRACEVRGGTLTLERLGPVGPDRHLGAQHRAAATGLCPLGEVVEQIDTAAGPAWRRTIWTESVVVTEIHLDHDGWAFVVRLRSGRDHDEVLASGEAVLSSWRWTQAVTSDERAA